MKDPLEIQVSVRRLPLSPASVTAIRNLYRYDLIVFTSKNARKFFAQELRRRKVPFPRQSRIIQVGPRVDVLKFPIDNKHILFPRSAIAPFDIVLRMRARGATVRVIPLYTTHGVLLSRAKKELLVRGAVKRLYFKSPSGITGLLQQLRKKEKQTVLSIPALCIGETTAGAARAAGFKKVKIKGIL